MLKIDLHVHSHYSTDGISKPEELLRTAKARGIGFAITEHNNCDSRKRLFELNKKFKIPLIFGEEKKLYSEEKMVGELLFYFLEKPIESKDLFEAIDEARKQDAIISVAHPFDIMRKPFWHGFRKLEEVKTKIDAVEAFNARVWFGAMNRRAEQFAEQNRLGFTAGSDAHTPKELGNAVAVCNADSLEEFRKCLKKKQAFFEGRLANPIVHFYSSLKSFGIIKSDLRE